MTVRDIVILGSTGSIGTQALDLVRANPDRFRVVGLSAGGGNRELFEAQVAEFSPAVHGLGEQASVDAAAHSCDVVLNGITVRGSIVGTRADLQEALDFAAEGLVKATIHTGKLENINQILDQLRAGQIEGRVVLEM